MAGEPHVAVFTGQRGPRDIADRETERPRVTSSANDRGNAKPRDFNTANGRACGGRRAARGRCRRNLVGRCALKDRVELLIFERLVKARFAVGVKHVTETHNTNDNQKTFEPPVCAPAARVPLFERAVEMLDEPEASPTPCRHCEP